ncbi:MAG: hypothetical protein UHM56_08730, partial [Phascolarctobacterium sp.]|nr:hypothetical protein [Phascolarctobacterium sp.]
ASATAHQAVLLRHSPIYRPYDNILTPVWQAYSPEKAYKMQLFIQKCPFPAVTAFLSSYTTKPTKHR